MKIVNGPLITKRHRPGNIGSEFLGDMDLLPNIVERNWSLKKPGYRDGVWLIPIKGGDQFRAGTKKYEVGDDLRAEFKPRRKWENPRLHNYIAVKEKPIAAHTDIVVYSNAVLAEGVDKNGNPTDDRSDVTADYELITILANPKGVSEDFPMSFMTACYNAFGAHGATDLNKTPEETLEFMRTSFNAWIVNGIFPVKVLDDNQ